MNTTVNPESKSFQKDLEKMSPFEIKNTLIDLAQKEARTSTDTYLNAGRGNPNWIATEPPAFPPKRG